MEKVRARACVEGGEKPETKLLGRAGVSVAPRWNLRSGLSLGSRPLLMEQGGFFSPSCPCWPDFCMGDTVAAGREICPSQRCDASLCPLLSESPSFPHPYHHENNFYTSLNDTSNMLKNHIVNEPICFFGSIYLFCPLSSTFWMYVFCNDDSLFCPQVHLSILPLYTSATRSIFLHVFLVYHFICFSYFSVSEGVGVQLPFFFHLTSPFSM